MMPTIRDYKGYSGVLRLEEEGGVLRGRVITLRDVITFQGETLSEAQQAFQDSVDDYLEFCAALGRLPEKPSRSPSDGSTDA